MFFDYEKSAKRWGESLVKKWIFGGVDLSNPPQKLGPIYNLPDELLKEIFEYVPDTFPSIAAVSQRFKKVQEKEDGIIKAALNVWPWIAPTFKDNSIPTFSDVKTAIYEHLLRELTQLRINPHEAGLLQDDPNTYKNANRLIEAKNFCLFFGQIAHGKCSVFLKTTEIFELEKTYRLEFETFDHKKVTSLNLHCQGLTRLPQEVALFENLEIMKLSLNYLTSLPWNMTKLKKLKNLNLAGNNFTTIPDSIYLLSALKSFSIHSNPIFPLLEAVGNLGNLESLSLPVYKLTELPESLKKLELLKELSLVLLVPFSLDFEELSLEEKNIQKKTVEKAASLLPHCQIKSHIVPWDVDSQGCRIDVFQLFQ